MMYEEEEVINAISIGIAVANFLLTSGHAFKAIELCQESLVLLSNKALSIEKQLGQIIYQMIYCTIFKVCHRVRDYTNAIAYGRKLIAIFRQSGDTFLEGLFSIKLAQMYQSQSMYAKAKEVLERAIHVMRTSGKRREEALAYEELGLVFQSRGEYVKAKEYYQKALAISREIGDKAREGSSCGSLGAVFRYLGEYVKAREYLDNALMINMENGNKAGESACYHHLGTVFSFLGEYVKAREYHEKALVIGMEIGDKASEANFCVNLGTVFYFLGDYVKAREFFEKALVISMKTGDKAGEAACYGNLAILFDSFGDYVKAREYQEKALVINMEIGNKAGEATCYYHLGTVFGFLGEYVKAREYHEKALVINMEIGDKASEAKSCGNLGTVFSFFGDYVKAREYFEKALVISMKTGDKAGEAACYGNLGTVFRSFGDYVKAREYFEKALVINMKTGNKAGEAACYGNLGTVFGSCGDYVKDREYQEKALVINMEIGNKTGEATCYSNLGSMFVLLGEYRKAEEYYKKTLTIQLEIGDLIGQAKTYIKLAGMFQDSQQYKKSKSYCDKALAISMRSGDKKAQADCYRTEGDLFSCLGDKEKAKACFEKALAVGICDRHVEALSYLGLGQVFQSLGNPDVAEEYFKKALSTSTEFGIAEMEFRCYYNLSFTKLLQKNLMEAFSFLLRSIEKSEETRGFLQDSDEMKISFADQHAFPYQVLSTLFLEAGNSNAALTVAELGRGRALADLMATQYSVEKRISWTGVENFMKKESDCTCLYISYLSQTVYLWILKTSGVIQFRRIDLDKKTLLTRLTKGARNLDEFFAIMAKSFGSFGILPAEVCEDRSIIDNNNETNPESCQEGSPATLRQGKPGDMDDPQPSLTLFYEMLVNPVSELLDEPEIIIVPYRTLYCVPFPALLNKRGKYLSENFRIRVVPSLSTLKLIQDSPADYHSQTGALIVGDPDVGSEVIYRGSVKRDFTPLPAARKEAEMIARRLGVWPLLGEHATKPAVLERIKSASLVHIAAHGNAERGEIALAPPASTTGIPQEGDYLLKMSDIAKVQVRAKLVVLSCCHSGRGQIRAEGVVGIARALVGSGARSVLVSLWALDDKATKKLMSRFYEHLVRGESASVSLHAAMKWMRDHGFIKVSSWAPFMLIGDDVTFAFEK